MSYFNSVGEYFSINHEANSLTISFLVENDRSPDSISLKYFDPPGAAPIISLGDCTWIKIKQVR